MQSPLVVDALREQLLRVLEWYHQPRPGYGWGTVIHRRNERGRLRFGAITPRGESFLLTEPMLDELGRVPCWLDGAVRVRLEPRRLTQPQPWLDALARTAPSSQQGIRPSSSSIGSVSRKLSPLGVMAPNRNLPRSFRR